MNIYQFKFLTEAEQDEIVMTHGIYLLNTVQGDTMCDVYKMYAFYVKFCYDLTNDKQPSIVVFGASDDFNLFKNGFSLS